MLSEFTIIVAGGSGSRMQSVEPKQFITLCGRPILMHTIREFTGYCKDMPIIVVLPAEYLDRWQYLCKQYDFTLPHRTVEGGSTRFHSVKNGLLILPDEGIVAIHDGVRPLVNQQTIATCFREAGVYGNAIPVTPVIDSVREISEGGNRMIDRSNLRLIQTPQVFDTKQLKKAYEQEYVSSFTDDASVFEKAGHTIRLVNGNVENIKITTPNDLIFGEALMSRRIRK